jgi:hypothetical protein
MAKRTSKTGKPSPGNANQVRKSPKKAAAGKVPGKKAPKPAKGVKDPLPGGDPFGL